jgi:hypothetical protein
MDDDDDHDSVISYSRPLDVGLALDGHNPDCRPEDEDEIGPVYA